MTTRTDRRTEFLSDLMIDALVDGYASLDVIGWAADHVRISFDDEPETVYTVTIATMAKGLGVIRDAVVGVVADPYGDGTVLFNDKTGERLYMSPEQRKAILEVDKSNADEGDYDVNDARAVLECALFGKVVYA